MAKLFSYGTLQQKNVQLANFGRELSGSKDILQGYIIGEVDVYVRVKATLKSATECWVYAAAEQI